MIYFNEGRREHDNTEETQSDGERNENKLTVNAIWLCSKKFSTITVVCKLVFILPADNSLSPLNGTEILGDLTSFRSPSKICRLR